MPVQNEEAPVERICYQTMRHEEGDEQVSAKDCILLASGNRKRDLPFIAKVTALWENPEDGKSCSASQLTTCFIPTQL